MPSTYTPRLGYELQGTFENLNTWGQRNNASVVSMADESWGGAVVTVNNHVTLTATQGATNQARRAHLKFTGAGGFNVTVPAIDKLYQVVNACAAAVTFKTSATAGVVIPPSRWVDVIWTGAALEMRDPVAQASDWAIKITGTVDGVSFSAKEYAQGSQAATGGSAKNWAQQIGADVTGAAVNSRSARSWAQDVLTGATLGGSAKDWAQHIGSTVDGTEYSARHHAEAAAASAQASSDAAGAAQTAQAGAEAAQGLAEDAQQAAEEARDLSQQYAQTIRGTSTTSVEIELGSKTFTTEASRQWLVGQRLHVASRADPTTHYVAGIVTAYSGDQLTLLIDTIGGSGPRDDWNIATGGEIGPDGPTGPAGDVLLYAAVSGNYTVISTDKNRLLDCAGTFTIALTAVATLGTPFSFYVKNTGTGIVTIDPNGAETIDGAATLAIAPGQFALIQSTGAAWLSSFISSGKWTQLAQTVVSSPAATVDFTSIPVDLGDIMVVFSGVSHNNPSDQSLRAALSSNNGSSWSPNLVVGVAGAFNNSALVDGQLLVPANGRAAIHAIFGYAGGSVPTVNNGAFGNLVRMAGAVNAIRFSMSAGSFDAGTFTLFGRG